MPPKTNNNNNNNKPQQSNNTASTHTPKDTTKSQESQQVKPPQSQNEVPPVVATIRGKNTITFMSLPIDPELFPKSPQRLPIVINNPTSDVAFSQLGDRCAVATTEGIMIYNTPLDPGSTFALDLHAQLPYTTARFVQFSPMGNYLISYETHQRSCRVNLVVWDLSKWKKNVCSAIATSTEEVSKETNDSSPESPTSPQEQDGEPAFPHPSVLYQMPWKSDLPTDIHSCIQWTDDENYCFILRDVGTLTCFKSNNMSKPVTSLQQKRMSAFQLSKIPKGGDKQPLPHQQHIILFSSSVGNEPAKCTIFRTTELIRGQSIKSGGQPPANAPKMPPLPIVWGPLKPTQQLTIFRSSKVKMEWHNSAQAVLLHAYFDDDNDSSYYEQTRLFVMYTDKEAVAVSFGNEDKADIHDAAWCPTGFEFATLHGLPRAAKITVWLARDCAAASILGEGPFNNIRYHPSGRLLLLSGTGALSGKMEIWDKQKLVKLYQGQDMDSPRTFVWSPCGRYFLSATIWPFLRVPGQFKIHRFDGKLLYQEKGEDAAKHQAAITAALAALQSDTQESPATPVTGAGATSTISAMHQGPSEGHFLQFVPNFYPRAGFFTDIKIPQELLQQAQTNMSALPSAAEQNKYIPPHLRDQMQSQPPPTSPPPALFCPRNLAQERKEGNLNGNDMGFGAKPALQFQEQQQQQKEQQKQQQAQQKQQQGRPGKKVVSDDAFGSWRG